MIVRQVTRSGGRGFRAGVAVSAALHLAALGAAWLAAAGRAPLPPVRVYAVEIVSPPPVAPGQVAEEPVQIAPERSDSEPPEPEPPPEAEPLEQLRPTTEPEPEPPEERPKTQETERAEPGLPRGPEPDPASEGGAGLNVRLEGAEFTDQAYLRSIYRAVNRYWRRPPDARSDRAEVRFRIHRDGSVDHIEVVRASGSFRFRASAMEAIEQAGLNDAFGPLPGDYSGETLTVVFVFRPSR
ncbi:MAG: TonB C-terminal domain-containing protein [Longimicrobiaceae bacterium]